MSQGKLDLILPYEKTIDLPMSNRIKQPSSSEKAKNQVGQQFNLLRVAVDGRGPNEASDYRKWPIGVGEIFGRNCNVEAGSSTKSYQKQSKDRKESTWELRDKCGAVKKSE
ncbi:hypothetical protein ACTXT7_015360, partial [Hymenolepis weldensis]